MRFWGLIRRRLQALFPSYRPERHYMRGPGPKWREHHGRPCEFGIEREESALRLSLFTGAERLTRRRAIERRERAATELKPGSGMIKKPCTGRGFLL